MDLRKRYIELAARDPLAPSPKALTADQLKQKIARYEATNALAVEKAGANSKEYVMAKAKKEAAEGEVVEKKGKGKAKAKGKPAKAAKSNGTGRPRTGVGATIRELIKKKPDTPNADIAAAALKAHPDSSTNAACVAWYKNDMRKKGEIKEPKKAA